MRVHYICILFAAIAAGAASGQPAGFAERDARYRLQPADSVELHYRYTPEFDQTVTVQPDGFVTLQIVGDLKLQGLTLEEAKAAILDRASLRLQNPEITLTLKEFEKPFYVVGGEVKNPGKFELRGQTTPMEAVAIAGGFTSASALHSQVVLFRRVGGDLARTEILNVKAFQSQSSTEVGPTLHSGDVLIVPQNRISKIERFVKWGTWGVFVNPVY
ncbi:MAG: polysaccharide biosynthesis/export family protein [Acidobacteriia bacterium]|nr:polysaccharide biosynthesis/export family protein [Terriglobia bacterium]